MESQLPLPTTTDERELGLLVDFVSRTVVQPEDVARLALHLAQSGDSLAWPDTLNPTDVASTGGPGSLSTLLAPVALNARGHTVVKLGIPGRPAGAIDALSTIPGYRVRLTPQEVTAVVHSCGFAHFLADARFAPLDAHLYAYRRRVGAVALPGLAAASLLAKKVAVGVRRVGLDVRVGSHGNFGLTRNDARANAVLFCEAGRVLGVTAAAFISAAAGPAQPLVGRGEALLGLAAAVGLWQLEGDAAWFEGHVRQCFRMAHLVASLGAGEHLDEGPTWESKAALRGALDAHFAAQGASTDAFIARVAAVAAAPSVLLSADAPGMLSLDLGILRDVLVAIQADGGGSAFLDPAGLQLLVRPGSMVEAGQPMARVRCEAGGTAMEDLVARLRFAFRVDEAAVARPDPVPPEGDPTEPGPAATVEVVRV